MDASSIDALVGRPAIKLSTSDFLCRLLEKTGVETVYAYPGTSELAFCDSVLASETISLINGRGDRECVFLAAGGSLFNGAKSAALLHGARGATNALGAIADVNRNEINMICFIGLPSTKSAKYLPPHGEPRLVENLSRFAKYAVEIDEQSSSSIQNLSQTVINAIKKLNELPAGIVLIGIPQDVLEKSWVMSEDELQNCCNELHAAVANTKEWPKNNAGVEILSVLENKTAVILIDDFLYKKADLKVLSELSSYLNAKVFQLEYRRGPVFFQQLDPSMNENFLGFYNPRNATHLAYLNNADVIITIEDRNMYQRNIGFLPDKRKIAITSNKGMTMKNGYLKEDDLLVYGDTLSILNDLIAISKKSFLANTSAGGQKVARSTLQPPHTWRQKLVSSISKCVANYEKVAWVDDGQIFGGVLKENFLLLPSNMQVFGDHGGFVGAGTGYATGVSISGKFDITICSLGDQALCNGIQPLYVSGALQPKIIYLVCNNRKSVSLLTQSAFNGFDNIMESDFLDNSPNIDYANLAKSIGLNAITIDTTEKRLTESYFQIESELLAAFASYPCLIELLCPSHIEAYDDLWACKGLDEK